MKQLVLCASLGFLLCGASPPAFADGSFALQYKMVKGFAYDDSLVSMSSQYLMRSRGRPVDLKGTPADAKGALTYFMGQFGERQVVVAMDTAGPPNLFIDSNANGDLSDEKPVKRTKVTGSRFRTAGDMHQYGPATLKLGGDAEAVGGRILFTRIQDDYLMAYPAGYLTGTASVEGKSYQIALVDTNYDGQYQASARFDEQSMRGGGNDTMAIDLNGNRQFEYNPYEQTEIQPLTAMVKLGGAYYQVKVAADGSTVDLAKTEPKMGTLAVKGANVELMVLGTSGPQYLKGKETSWQLPEGRYTCQAISLVTTDEKKAKWALRSSGQTGKLRDFTIAAGETFEVELGSPLTIKADVQQQAGDWVFKGKTVSVGFTITGQGGEEYTPAAERNGARVPAPKITIYDAKDSVLAQGDFAYG